MHQLRAVHMFNPNRTTPARETERQLLMRRAEERRQVVRDERRSRRRARISRAVRRGR
jgi:hypothetical protein